MYMSEQLIQMQCTWVSTDPNAMYMSYYMSQKSWPVTYYMKWVKKLLGHKVYIWIWIPIGGIVGDMGKSYIINFLKFQFCFYIKYSMYSMSYLSWSLFEKCASALNPSWNSEKGKRKKFFLFQLLHNSGPIILCHLKGLVCI